MVLRDPGEKGPGKDRGSEGRRAVIGDVAEVEVCFGVRVAGTGHDSAEERLLGWGLVVKAVLSDEGEMCHDATCIAG